MLHRLSEYLKHSMMADNYASLFTGPQSGFHNYGTYQYNGRDKASKVKMLQLNKFRILRTCS